MSEKFSHIPEMFSESKPERADISAEAKDILDTIDTIIETHLKFEKKDNEGQQALIFKLDVEADMAHLSKEEKKQIENYIGPSKSLKILKVTDEAMARHEFEWQYKAHEAFEAIPEHEKQNYASIPKIFLTKTVHIDNDIKAKLNKQNAKLTTESASVIMMEWVEGEDLLTKVFRQYLSDIPAYVGIANDPNTDFGSLLFAVSSDFRTKGLDFSDMSTLEQYRKLFSSIVKNNREILTKEQQVQVENTMQLLHQNGIHHNDLHLRNFLVSPGENGKVYIIDFGRAHGLPKSFDNDIKDDFAINLIKEFKLDSEKNDAIKMTIENDINRIINRNDRTFQDIVTKLLTLKATDLIKYMERESSQWRYDPWNVKIMAAAVQSIRDKDPTKAELVKSFMETKKNHLIVESQTVIDFM